VLLKVLHFGFTARTDLVFFFKRRSWHVANFLLAFLLSANLLQNDYNIDACAKFTYLTFFFFFFFNVSVKFDIQATYFIETTDNLTGIARWR
jgi:hypothetical protein